MTDIKVHDDCSPAGEIPRRFMGAATRLFMEKGYGPTTVREIITASGESRYAFYRYFGSKEGIYRSILNKLLADYNNRMAKCRRQPGNASARLWYLCDQAADFFQSHLEAVRLFYGIHYGPPQGVPHFDFCLFHRAFTQAVRTIIADGIRLGEFRDGGVDEMTLAVYGVCRVVTERQLTPSDTPFDRSYLARTLRVVLQGMEGELFSGPRKSVPEARRSLRIVGTNETVRL
jgi:AcrR family transcriptional regulator